MISNYIKLAWRVLGRNKFFSAITLFGISFTLAILMLIVSFLETEVGSTKPVSDRDKMVVLPYLHLSRQYYDTIFVYDTLIVDEEFVIDTTYNLEEAGSSNSNSQYAWWFLDRYFSDVDHVRDHTFFNSGTSFNAYVNNSKVEMNVIYADHGFWDVFDFRFREGFGFDDATVDQESPVAIVTTDLADEYFGRRSGILGEELIMNGRTYKVTGLIDPPGVSILTFDIVVPRTLLDENSRGVEMGFGGYMASFVGEKSSDVELIKESISVIESTIEIPAPAQEDFDRLRVNEQSYHEIYADQILDLDEPEDSLRVMKWVIISLLALFIILPALNLINLNVSRILERSSEIGVRKAFGAHQSIILTQFIIENVVQCLVGGIIGLGLATLLIYIINDVRLLGDVLLKVNFRFFFWSLLLAVVFGVVSGLLPAYRMSRLQIVSALKQNKL